MAEATVICPQCGSNRIYRDGIRYLTNGENIQRWLCRDCGLRFSDAKDVERAKEAFEGIG